MLFVCVNIVYLSLCVRSEVRLTCCRFISSGNVLGGIELWKAKGLYKYCMNNYQPFQLMYTFSLDLLLPRTLVQEDFKVFTCCWKLVL